MIFIFHLYVAETAEKYFLSLSERFFLARFSLTHKTKTIKKKINV